MAEYVHFLTDWHDRITKKGYTELFRWRVIDPGRPGHTKLRVAFPKNAKARKLIGGRSSVVTDVMVEKKYESDIERILKLLRKQGHEVERVVKRPTGLVIVELDKKWKRTWVNPYYRTFRGKLVRVRGHWRRIRPRAS